MKRHISTTFAAMFAMTALACGGGDSASTQTADAANPCAANPCAGNPCAANPCAGMDSPDWFVIDEAARTATIDISAGTGAGGSLSRFFLQEGSASVWREVLGVRTLTGSRL